MISRSEQETFETARQLATELPMPAHILLYGDLGSGKTAFTRGLCVGFGIEDPDEVASPTFTLVNQYRGRTRIYHIDLYRMEPGAANATDGLGLDELFDDPDAAVIIEWAERLGAAEPRKAVRVAMEYVDENSRKIDIRR